MQAQNASVACGRCVGQDSLLIFDGEEHRSAFVKILAEDAGVQRVREHTDTGEKRVAVLDHN